MIIYDDGSFFLEKGELVPFVCPSCGWPKEFSTTAPEFLTCKRCRKSASKKEFLAGRVRFLPDRKVNES
jgi:hypothetical protein